MGDNFWFKDYFIAHRGLHSDDAPENTILAFKNAVNCGYAIELDVQQISDGNIIVFHDSKLERLTGKDGYTKNLKLEDLKNCHILGSEQTIPLLSEVLEIVDGKVPLLIEIKNEFKVGAQEKAVLELLKGYSGKVAIQSFNPYVVQYVKQKAPNLAVGQLSSYFKNSKMSWIRKYVLKRLKFIKSFKADFISYDAQNLPNKYVNKHKNLPLLAFTVKTQEEYERLYSIVDSIIFEDFTPVKINADKKD